MAPDHNVPIRGLEHLIVLPIGRSVRGSSWDKIGANNDWFEIDPDATAILTEVDGPEYRSLDLFRTSESRFALRRSVKGGNLKIKQIRSVPYEYSMTRRIGDSHLPLGTDVGADTAVFVDTDEGITGVAVAYGHPVDTIASLERLLIGEDPRSVRGLWERMVAFNFKMGVSGTVKIALSAIDCALWDLRAKANGVPLWKELGGLEGKASAYASGLDTPLSDEELSSFYRRMARLGFNAGKLKVGLDQETDLRRLAIMHEALAESGRHPVLMVDSNEYLSAKQAIRRITEMEREFDLVWAEEPAARWDARGLRQVSNAIRAAVATGENLDQSSDFAVLIRQRAVDIVQIGDLTSGITGALQVAELAYSHGLPVAMMYCPGNYMAHLAAALPHHTMMEVLDAGQDAVFASTAHLANGEIVLGDEPGLGISFDEDLLEQHRPTGLITRSLGFVYRRSRRSWRDESRGQGWTQG